MLKVSRNILLVLAVLILFIGISGFITDQDKIVTISSFAASFILGTLSIVFTVMYSRTAAVM